YEERGLRQVEVRAETHIALNGRRSAVLIDPQVDLAAQSEGWSSKPWITPAPDRPPIHTRPVLRSKGDTLPSPYLKPDPHDSSFFSLTAFALIRTRSLDLFGSEGTRPVGDRPGVGASTDSTQRCS